MDPSVLDGEAGEAAGREHARHEERETEEARQRRECRQRIARELHDTLLQGFQGLVLRFQAATQSIPAEHAARRMMETALDQADVVMVEGRDVRDWAVDELRARFAVVPQEVFLFPGTVAANIAAGDEVIVTEDMHQRKHRMFEESDAFVALPGGIGTLEEIIEVMTWGQLGHHRKPMVFANINGFWDPLLVSIEHMRKEGFIHTGHLVKPLVVGTADAVVPAIVVSASSDSAPTEGVKSVIDRM